MMGQRALDILAYHRFYAVCNMHSRAIALPHTAILPLPVRKGFVLPSNRNGMCFVAFTTYTSMHTVPI
jgi:hypothetical protein